MSMPSSASSLRKTSVFLNAMKKGSSSSNGIDTMALLRQIVHTGAPEAPVAVRQLLKEGSLSITEVAPAIQTLERAGYVSRSRNEEDGGEQIAATPLGLDIVKTF